MAKEREFIFNGKCAADFGFMVIGPDEESSLGTTRDVISTTLTPTRNTIDIYGMKYRDTLPLKFLIIKDKCKIDSQGDWSITPYELSELQAWLTSPKTPRKLYIIHDSFKKEYTGVFTEIAPLEVGSRLYGLKVTFLCNSPYGYISHTDIVRCTDSAYDPLVIKTGELEEYIYPTIRILTDNSGTFSITNETEERTMSITTRKNYKEIMIDCAHNRIVGDGKPLKFSDIGWDSKETIDWNGVGTGTFQLYWLRFLPGYNKLSFTGNATFKIEYKTPVKTGGY